MKFGSDPEFFILDAGGKSIPAHKRLPGKNAPLQVAARGQRKGAFSFFRDGYALEVNVPPADTVQELTWSMQAALDCVRTFVLSGGERLTTLPGIPVSWGEMKGAPEDVMSVGCDPSEDAYTGDKKYPTLDPATAKERFSGGHMHFSTPKKGGEGWALRKNIPRAVKMLDLFVGLPLTFFFPSKEGFHRRLFYGQAGEFRFQDYGSEHGLEYRVPSPEVWGHPAVASFAFETAAEVLRRGPSLWKNWDSAIEDDLRGAINWGTDVEKLLTPLEGVFDVATLKKLCGRFRPLVEEPLSLEEESSHWSLALKAA